MNFRNVLRIDYSKCNQTVTIYRADLTRVVIHNAFFDFRKRQSIDKTGASETNNFLLVVPYNGNDELFKVGDKVLLGEGGEITKTDWLNMVPSNTSGLVVIKSVDPKYFNNRIVHWECEG